MRQFETLSLAFVFLTLVAGNAFAQTVDLDPYFNFTPGSTQLYLSAFKGGLPDWIWNAFVEYWFSLGDGNIGVTSLSWPDLIPGIFVGIFASGVDGKYGVGGYLVEQDYLTVSIPGLGPYGSTMEVGEAIHSESITYDATGPISESTLDLVFLAAGLSYSTPAGTFDDCVLIEIENHIDYGDGTHIGWTEYWILARNVGMILSIMSDDVGIAVSVLLSQFN
jgi:hypothetical protein